MEHHSNIVPWQMVCEQTGAELVVAPINEAGELELDEFFDLLDEKVRFVALAHVSNALGSINPVEEIIARCEALDVPVLLDGAQGVPHMASTCSSWAAIFTPFRRTRCSARPASACCSAGKVFWKKCRPTKAAAT